MSDAGLTDIRVEMDQHNIEASGPSDLQNIMLSHAQFSTSASNSTKIFSHQHPARRRSARSSRRSYSSSLIFAITLLLCSCTLTKAEYLTSRDASPEALSDLQPLPSHEFDATLSQLLDPVVIQVDQRKKPQELEKRTVTSTAKATPASSTVASTSSSTASQSAVAVVIPTAFDGSGIGTNFTSKTCPAFITSFLQDSQFTSCIPVSLLLGTSVAFFRAEQSLVKISQVLDAACSLNSTHCTEYISALATNMTSSSVCGADLKNSIQVVQQIQTGLLAYNTMYTATCLKNNATGSYCFADAITNSSSPTDSYVYYLPLNQTLVGGSQPTCNKCLQSTMSVFQAASANRSNTVAGVYADSARLVNQLCGPGFVNSTIPNPAKGGAAAMRAMSWLGTAFIAGVMLTLLI